MGRNISATLLDAVPETGTVYSDALDISNSRGYFIQASWVANGSAKTFACPGVAEVQTLLFDTEANSGHQDFAIVYDAAGNAWAVALTKPLRDVSTITLDTKSNSGQGDFCIFYSTTGAAWAFALDKAGSGAEPTSGLWTQLSRNQRVVVNISGATTGADVATLVRAALIALPGFTSAFTCTRSTADLLMTSVDYLPATISEVHNTGATGAGSITKAHTVTGRADEGPAGDLWSAVPAARKCTVDVTGASTAAAIAALVETAMNAMTGFTAAMTTDDTAADGHISFTQAAEGPVTALVVKNAAEDGAGSISGSEGTVGVANTVDLTANTIAIASHGMLTGTKAVLTKGVEVGDAVPTGLTDSSTYYVIKVGASSIKLASSYANALAGTAIDITAEGQGTNTLTPTSTCTGTLTLQESIDGSTWADVDTSIAASVSVSGPGSGSWNVETRYANYARIKLDMSTAQAVVTASGIAKGY